MKEKPHDRIVEEISSEDSPNKGEPSVDERYVVDKNNTIGLNLMIAILQQL
jgi:hypothetical protein